MFIPRPTGRPRLQARILAPRAFDVLQVALALLPRLLSDFRAGQAGLVAVYFIALIGLNILTGLSGQVSLGHGAFMAVGGWIVMQLWNWLVPSIVGWRTITFWQALGLLLLSRILVGGHGLGGGRRGRCRHRMRDHWESLTPEERERFRQKMRERWGDGEPSAAGGGGAS